MPSVCRRYPAAERNGVVSPMSSIRIHDLYVIPQSPELFMWVMLDSDVLVGFPASCKLLPLAQALVLL